MSARHTKRLPVLIATLAAVALATGARADVVPNGVFASHMVLQRDVRIPVWGTASPGEAITVTLGAAQATATADPAGQWRVDLPPQPLGAPTTLSIHGKNEVTYTDVLIGDVWLCSGQSNMAFSMGSLKTSPYASDLTSADFPNIRQGLVPRKPSRAEVTSAPLKWTICTPETVADFTAAGFYFAREVQRQTKVPIGLLHASWGGTSAESWTSRQAIDTVPTFKERAEQQWRNIDGLPKQIADFPGKLAAWEAKYGRADTATLPAHPEPALPETDASSWKTVKLNTRWRDAGLPDGGIAWLRKELVLPAGATGFHVDLGGISEQCITAYFNGEKLAEFGRKAPAFYSGYFGFDVPAKLIRPGKNVLAFRFVSATGDRAGTTRTADQIGLSASKAENLSDDVQFLIERAFKPLPKGALAERPETPTGDAAHTSGYLFAGMIRPLIPLPIKGALWYQGEQDGSRGFAYRTLLPLLIRDWRTRWGEGDFPFYVQQLPNWAAGAADGTGWAEVREAQWLTAKTVPNCFVSCAIDIGESGNVHPMNKRELGRRLALTALRNTYGLDVACTGPRYASCKATRSVIRVSFSDASGLKTTDGKPLHPFVIAGADRKFVPAEARIDGDSVVVSSPSVPAPVAVRYAYVNDPVGANLTNDSGLPALPFRSDDWPISSQSRP